MQILIFTYFFVPFVAFSMIKGLSSLLAEISEDYPDSIIIINASYFVCSFYFYIRINLDDAAIKLYSSFGPESCAAETSSRKKKNNSTFQVNKFLSIFFQFRSLGAEESWNGNQKNILINVFCN